MHAHAGILGRLELVPHINLGGGVVADEHDRERGRAPEPLLNVGYPSTELVADLLGNGLAVEKGRGH